MSSNKKGRKARQRREDRRLAADGTARPQGGDRRQDRSDLVIRRARPAAVAAALIELTNGALTTSRAADKAREALAEATRAEQAADEAFRKVRRIEPARRGQAVKKWTPVREQADREFEQLAAAEFAAVLDGDDDAADGLAERRAAAHEDAREALAALRAVELPRERAHAVCVAAGARVKQARRDAERANRAQVQADDALASAWTVVLERFAAEARAALPDIDDEVDAVAEYLNREVEAREAAVKAAERARPWREFRAAKDAVKAARRRGASRAEITELERIADMARASLPGEALIQADARRHLAVAVARSRRRIDAIEAARRADRAERLGVKFDATGEARARPTGDFALARRLDGDTRGFVGRR